MFGDAVKEFSKDTKIPRDVGRKIREVILPLKRGSNLGRCTTNC
jgi:hypothetical protein